MITNQQASEAVDRMTALRYFPSEPLARDEIARMLLRMVDNAAQLNWLVCAVLEYCDEWPGPKEIRGLFCTRFQPIDGVVVFSAIPGFTAKDPEQARRIKAAELKALMDRFWPLMPS